MLSSRSQHSDNSCPRLETLAAISIGGDTGATPEGSAARVCNRSAI
jgi:hypothetical protein